MAIRNMQHDPNSGSDDLSGVATALDSMQAESQLLCHALGIFPEGTYIPRNVIFGLWKQLQPDLDGQVMEHLLDQLAVWDLIELDAKKAEVILHCPLIQVASARLKDSAAQTHAALLQSYNPCSFRWHKILDDGYLYDHLADHLRGAQHDDALDGLFNDDLWMQVRFVQCGYNYMGFLDDLMVAWRWAASPKRGFDAASFVRCIRYALIRAAVNSLTISYVPELAFRACETGQPDWPLARATALMNRLGEALSYEAEYGTPSTTHDPQTDHLSQSRTLLAIEYPVSSPMLAASVSIFACTPSEMAFKQALDNMRAPGLPTSAHTEAVAHALKSASVIDDPHSRACALTLLAPYLSSDMIPHALNAALAIRNAYYRAAALSALASRLSGEALRRALDSTPSIDGPTTIQHIIALILQVAAPIARSVISIGRSLLGQIQAVLDPDYARRALAELPGMKYDEQRAEAIGTLAPYLRDEVAMQRALDSALVMHWEDDRAAALAGLAIYLPAHLFTRALDSVKAIRYPLLRVKTLIPFLLAATSTRADIVGRIRAAAGDHLMSMREAGLTEVALFCFDETLFSLPVLSVSDIAAIHAWVRRLCQIWRWQ